ncbi:MAG: hypothetical protein ACRECD_04665 [Burkholderiaceae bacterium]
MSPLTETRAQRRFAICFRDEHTLSPAARLLVDHLANAGTAEAK